MDDGYDRQAHCAEREWNVHAVHAVHAVNGDHVSAEETRGDQAAGDAEAAPDAARSEDPAASDDVAIAEGELRKAVERAEELAGRWQRTQADFINYKRRSEQERAELAKLANLSLIARILPVLDDFERAMATPSRELHSLTWLGGIALIQHKLQYLLEQEGLIPIEALGKDFDPTLHEAVMLEEGVSPHESKVVAELQRGYKLHDRVLRPALVKVGRGPVETGKE